MINPARDFGRRIRRETARSDDRSLACQTGETVGLQSGANDQRARQFACRRNFDSVGLQWQRLRRRARSASRLRFGQTPRRPFCNRRSLSKDPQSSNAGDVGFKAHKPAAIVRRPRRRLLGAFEQGIHVDLSLAQATRSLPQFSNFMPCSAQKALSRRHPHGWRAFKLPGA